MLSLVGTMIAAVVAGIGGLFVARADGTVVSPPSDLRNPPLLQAPNSSSFFALSSARHESSSVMSAGRQGDLRSPLCGRAHLHEGSHDLRAVRDQPGLCR